MFNIKFVDYTKNDNNTKNFLKTLYPQHFALNPMAVFEFTSKIKDLNKKINYIYEDIATILKNHYPEDFLLLKKLQIAYSFKDMADFLNTIKKQKQIIKDEKQKALITLPRIYIKTGDKLDAYLKLIEQQLINVIKYHSQNKNVSEDNFTIIINKLNTLIDDLNQNEYNRLYGVYNEKYIYITDTFFKSDLNSIQRTALILHELHHIKNNIFGKTLEHITSKMTDLLLEQNKPLDFLIYLYYLNIYLNIIADFFANKDVYRDMKNKKIISTPQEIFPDFFVDKKFMINFVLKDAEIYSEKLTFDIFLEEFFNSFVQAKLNEIKKTDIKLNNFLRILNKQETGSTLQLLINPCHYSLNKIISTFISAVTQVYLIKNILDQHINNIQKSSDRLSYQIDKTIKKILYHLRYVINKNKFYVYQEYSNYLSSYKNIIEEINNIHKNTNQTSFKEHDYDQYTKLEDFL